MDRFKTDHGSNIVGGAIEEFSKELGIWQDKSSAYHASGNRCVEKAVGRIKRAINMNKIEDAVDDISSLNMSSPYNNKTLAPVKELYGRVAPVNGIPRPHYLDKDLVDRQLMTEKVQRAEHTGSNPEAKAFTPEDKHSPTQEENDFSADWVEKINGEVNMADELTCGDRVYYIDHQKAVKGPGRCHYDQRRGLQAEQLLTRADFPRGLKYQREENIYHFQLASSQHLKSETSLQGFSPLYFVCL